MKNSKHDHTNKIPYVIGFGLSLIATIIPYLLVTREGAANGNLLSVILGFGFVQMLIQLFFFLHLGRGPKPVYNLIFTVGTAGMIFVTVFGAIYIMNNLYDTMTPKETTTRLAEKEGIAEISGQKTGACQGVYENHKVYIKTGLVTPKETVAHLCDTITFIDQSNNDVKIGYGEHDSHSTYGGIKEFSITKIRPQTITLNQAGTFEFHNHYDQDASGSFLVAP